MDNDLPHFWKDVAEGVSAAWGVALAVVGGIFHIGRKMENNTLAVGHLGVELSEIKRVTKEELGEIRSDIKEIKSQVVDISTLNVRMAAVEKRMDRVEYHERHKDEDESE